MIHILVVSPTSEWGGPETGLFELIRNIDPKRVQFSIVFPAPGPNLQRFQAIGTSIYFAHTATIEKSRVPFGLATFGFELLSGGIRIAKLARRIGADAILTNCAASVAGVLASFLARRPHVLYAREIIQHPLLTQPLYWSLCRGSSRVLALSKGIGDFLSAYCCSSKIEVVYDCLDPGWFEIPERTQFLFDELSIDPGCSLVATVARVCPQKGIHVFFEAARLVHSCYPEAVFLVIGDIPRARYRVYKESLMARSAAYGLDRTIRFLGWRSDIKRLLSLCAVNVLASVGPEGAGRVIGEGWAVGVPAVVPDHTGPAELVRDGIDGFHFRSGDAADLAEKIVILLKDSQRRTQMGRAGRERALELFDARKNAARVCEILEALVAASKEP